MKECYFCQNKIKEINYQDSELLWQFMSGQGKIISAKRTGNCAKHQRKLTKAIKRARILGLIPFTRK